LMVIRSMNKSCIFSRVVVITLSGGKIRLENEMY